MPIVLEPASATPPSSVVLEYFLDNATLRVTITHNTPAPNYHYIGSVDILKNGALDSTYQYTDQPTNSVFSYDYTVQAANGDVLAARAVCNLAGELTSEITVEGPVLPMTLGISPEITSIEEGGSRDLTVNVYSGSDPVDGVEIAVSASIGSVSEVEPLGIGGYQFTYDAPQVDADSGEVLTISGHKNGYEDAALESSFPVVDLDSSDRIRVEFVDPPRTVEEGASATISFLLMAGGEPVEGASVQTSASLGETGAAEEGVPGEYSFPFTAPDVTSDMKATLTVEASRPPLEDGSGTVQLTVRALKKVLDGRISGDEYEHSATPSDDMEFHWTVDGTELSMALKARTTGWIAVGFGASSLMKDADIIMGYVDGTGKAVVLDCRSTGNYGPHPPDTQMGGADDLIAVGGAESGGWTTIEFIRPLDSPDDRFDEDIDPSKKAELIWAIGPGDDPLGQHGGTGVQRGHYTMDWSRSGDNGEGRDYPRWMWIFEIATMTLVGLMAADTLREKPLLIKTAWPLRERRKWGAILLIFAISTIVVGLFMFLR